MPRLKKSTKKRLIQVMAVLLCALMFLPTLSYFVPDSSKVDGQTEVITEDTMPAESVPEHWEGPYEVLAVKDGDRIHIALDNDTFQYIDLLGIESPPVEDPETGIETEAGLDAYSYTRCLIEGHQVYLDYEEESSNQDEMKALVYLDNGLFLNEQILWDGFAKVSSPLPADIEKAFLNAEKEAKKNKTGLWGDVWNEENDK